MKSDHRMLSEAAEAYAVEHGTYPPWDGTHYGSSDNYRRIPHRGLYRAWIALTTPVAFVGSSIENFVDPFVKPNTRYELPNSTGIQPVNGRKISVPIPNRARYYEVGFGSTFGATTFLIEEYRANAPLRHVANPPPAREVHRDAYVITSVGPDLLDSMMEARWGFTRFMNPWDRPGNMPAAASGPHFWNTGSFLTYDPSNGIDSLGDIYRISGRTPAWWDLFNFPLITP